MTTEFWQALAAWAFVQEQHDRALFGLQPDEIPNGLSSERVEIFRLHFRLKALYERQELIIWRKANREEYDEETAMRIIREAQQRSMEIDQDRFNHR